MTLIYQDVKPVSCQNERKQQITMKVMHFNKKRYTFHVLHVLCQTLSALEYISPSLSLDLDYKTDLCEITAALKGCVFLSSLVTL